MKREQHWFKIKANNRVLAASTKARSLDALMEARTPQHSNFCHQTKLYLFQIKSKALYHGRIKTEIRFRHLFLKEHLAFARLMHQ